MKGHLILSLSLAIMLLSLGCQQGEQEGSRAAEGDALGLEDALSASGPDAALHESGLAPSLSLESGLRIGPVSVGMVYTELLEALGEPDSAYAFNRIVTLNYLELGLQVALTSSDPLRASEDARVVSIATLSAANLEGVYQHGMSRMALEVLLGEAFLETRGVAYYPASGMAVKFNALDEVTQFAMWPSYVPQIEPPEMLPAQSVQPPPMVPKSEGSAILYEIDGESYEVVDIHLHTGDSASMHPDGIAFLLSVLPAPSVLNFPATSQSTRAPYDPHVGIQEHLRSAGVAHGVILATYTHHTIGYTENRLIEEMLDDPRNVNPDGSRWAWGMASINFEGYEEPGVAEARLEALASYFKARPDLFIGIKLAHAHQAVSFDDPAYLGVYDIAAEFDVPVLLHTGFSPFPHSMTEPDYYDPASLEAVIEAYDGTQGAPKVEFVLAHAGQGDARSIEHSLYLAETYDNVWLELSAIHRPLSIDIEGQATESDTPMHPYVLEQIKARGIIDRAIYATDGPQFFGKSQSYLAMLVEAMKEEGYTQGELAAVLAGNFYTCFEPATF